MPTTPVAAWGIPRLDPFMTPENASEVAVQLKPSTTFRYGTVLGQITATPGVWGPYASGNVDGSQNARLILRYSCVTDAAGKITIGDQVPPGAAEHLGHTVPSVDAFYAGTFKTTDLVGLDAGGLTAMGGRIIFGTLADGVVVIPG